MTLERPTPTHPTGIASVTLRARDVPRLASFYGNALGLTVRAGATEDVADLSVGDDILLRLRRTDARRPDRRTAGLFHTAFLLADRASLAAWLHAASARNVPIIGASDHGVSEAVYLADPEGNGIEVYVDRPEADWRDAAGRLRMPSNALDVADLLAAAKEPWTEASARTRVGHVHLSVGNIAAAETFWTKEMGLAVTTRYPGAAFLAWGGYHHHVAINNWGLRGAPVPSDDAPGLAAITFRGEASLMEALRDPGTGARLTTASADQPLSVQPA